MSGVAGRAERVYAPGEWVSPLNQRPVDAPVLQLEGGHTFVVDDGLPVHAMLLSEAEVQFLLRSQEVLDMAARELGAYGHSAGVAPDRGVAVLCAVLGRALRALQPAGP